MARQSPSSGRYDDGGYKGLTHFNKKQQRVS